jgi:chromosome segregation ATPase
MAPSPVVTPSRRQPYSFAQAAMMSGGLAGRVGALGGINTPSAAHQMSQSAQRSASKKKLAVEDGGLEEVALFHDTQRSIDLSIDTTLDDTLDSALDASEVDLSLVIPAPQEKASPGSKRSAEQMTQTEESDRADKAEIEELRSESKRLRAELESEQAHSATLVTETETLQSRVAQAEAAMAEVQEQLRSARAEHTAIASASHDQVEGMRQQLEEAERAQQQRASEAKKFKKYLDEEKLNSQALESSHEKQAATHEKEVREMNTVLEDIESQYFASMTLAIKLNLTAGDVPFDTTADTGSLHEEAKKNEIPATDFPQWIFARLRHGGR